MSTLEHCQSTQRQDSREEGCGGSASSGGKTFAVERKKKVESRAKKAAKDTAAPAREERLAVERKKKAESRAKKAAEDPAAR